MKKILLLLCILMSGCLPSYLKSDYKEHTVWKQSDRTFEQSFDRAIEVFVDMGYELQGVDRPNGVIQFKMVMPSSHNTKEKKGRPIDDSKYIVVAEGLSTYLQITGLFTVLVRPLDNKSLIGIRLTTWIDMPKGVKQKYSSASLGNYERDFLEILLAKDEKIK